MVLGKRAASPIKSVSVLVAENKKNTYPKITIPNLFYGDRKKFKAYYTQIRLYFWSDFKRISRALKTKPEKIMWVVFYLRSEAFARFESYIVYYLERGNVASYDLMVAKIMDTVGHYLKFLL
jgi:hypothetical protein